MKKTIGLLLFSAMASAFADDMTVQNNGTEAEFGNNSIAELSADWWRWNYAHQPALTEGAIDCSVGQHDNVWFLAGTMGGGSVIRECSVPQNRYLFFPNITVAVFNTSGENMTLAEKRVEAERYMLEVPGAGDGGHHAPNTYRSCGLMTTVNGSPSTSAGFGIIRAQSEPFFTPHNPDSTDPEHVSDGYWTMLKLPAGDHTVRIQGGVCDRSLGDYVFEVDVTYLLHVS